MKVVIGLPPNFEEIAAALPRARSPNVLFSYGDTIYNPSGVPISEALMAHETVHGFRQDPQTPGSVDRWWKQYLADPTFRFDEERRAHIAELWVVTLGWATRRHHRAGWLNIIAHRLSSSLYGAMIPLHKAESILRNAMKARKEGLDDDQR